MIAITPTASHPHTREGSFFRVVFTSDSVGSSVCGPVNRPNKGFTAGSECEGKAKTRFLNTLSPFPVRPCACFNPPRNAVTNYKLTTMFLKV